MTRTGQPVKLAKPIRLPFSVESMIQSLHRTLFAIACHPLGQRLAKASRIVPLGNWALRILPQRRTLPDSGVTYRIPFVDSVLLARSIFKDGEYACRQLDESLPAIETVVDLGCNVGYFFLYLEHLRRSRGCARNPLCGIAVDCNAQALDRARDHLRWNQLDGVYCTRGVAAGQREGSAAVFLASSTTSSTASPGLKPSSMVGVSVVEVPYVDVGRLWAERFPGRRVDLCKLDIEGSEVEFLAGNTEFMRRVDQLLLEWHKLQVTLDEVVDALSQSGDWQIEPLHEDSRFGVLWASRNS